MIAKYPSSTTFNLTLLTNLALLTVGALIFGPPSLALAQSSSSSSSSAAPSGPDPDAIKNSILEDVNGDGLIQLEAFGDSITRGVGDFVPAGEEDLENFPDITGKEAGYPLRVETLLGISVKNSGVPGEILNTEGLVRFIATLPQTLPDTVFISGGANDANDRASTTDFNASLQTMINFARAVGVNVVLVTTPRPGSDHENLAPFVDAYVTQMRASSIINDLPLADANQAFSKSCNISRCYLLNLPEGLHPNIEGYDIMGEAVLASIFRIDLNLADGAGKLETALNLPAGTVKTKPLPVAAGS